MNHPAKAALAVALALTTLAACGAQTGVRQGANFENRYLVARNALDEGRYDIAVSGFRALAAETTNQALAHRLTLELAHSHLRQSDYASASATARGVADTAQGEARALALAVTGTAQHEQARQHAANGRTTEARALLSLAETDLSQMLELAPDLDAGGAMADRLRLVRSELGR